MSLLRRLIRMLAFFEKEIAEAARQPRLILTLVIGPFLILLLFGIGFRQSNPPLRVLYVTQENDPVGGRVEDYAKELGSQLTFAGITASEAEARSKLQRRQVDIVVVIPPDASQKVQLQEQTPFRFLYNEVNPMAADHIGFIAQILVSVMNRHVLEDLQRQGQVPILVQPFKAEPMTVAASEPTLSEFFAPAVIILLLQHLAVTFGSLSIVRERHLGTLELFRVSPISATETLAGKYLGYVIFGALVSLILVAAMVFGVNVPMLGSWMWMTLAMAVVLFASLGFGFVLSLLAGTDSQAVQYAMIVLLTSFFFSGFVLSIETLAPAVRVISWLMPATYGIKMLQDVMLRGVTPAAHLFLGPLALGVVLLMLALVLMRRRMARAV